jgi:hypothetical protein
MDQLKAQLTIEWVNGVPPPPVVISGLDDTVSDLFVSLTTAGAGLGSVVFEISSDEVVWRRWLMLLGDKDGVVYRAADNANLSMSTVRSGVTPIPRGTVSWRIRSAGGSTQIVTVNILVNRLR